MKDKLGYSPLAQKEDSCYITPINEIHNSYNCLVSGFTTNDLMIEGEFDFEKYEEILPELYKEIKQVDSDNRVWYPTVVDVKNSGTVFVNGTSSDNWGWSGIKYLPNTVDGEEPKLDYKTLQTFSKFEFIEALDYIGVL